VSEHYNALLSLSGDMEFHYETWLLAKKPISASPSGDRFVMNPGDKGHLKLMLYHQNDMLVAVLNSISNNLVWYLLYQEEWMDQHAKKAVDTRRLSAAPEIAESFI
jgi:hypothetical protein